MKPANIGMRTEIEAIPEVKSSPTVFATDDGDYVYYTLVKEYAAGYCIKWGGMATVVLASLEWIHYG